MNLYEKYKKYKSVILEVKHKYLVYSFNQNKEIVYNSPYGLSINKTYHVRDPLYEDTIRIIREL
jgi:cell division ATPase FtsA